MANNWVIIFVYGYTFINPDISPYTHGHGAGDDKVQSKIQFPWQPDLLGPNILKSLSLTRHSITLGSYFSAVDLTPRSITTLDQALLWHCLQLCSMLVLFISSCYKRRSDIWACYDAPSISTLNMCLPDQDGGWRLRWRMLQICCTGIMYKTDRDVEVWGKVLLGICVPLYMPLCWGMCRTWPIVSRYGQ